MDRLTIGKLAERGGVGVETIRYYERRGLLAEPPRTAGRFRQYGPDVVRQVRFIKRAQQLGFTLREIGELLDLRIGRTCGKVRGRAEVKLAEIEQKLEDLRRMRKALKELTDHCDSGPTDRACPIIESLEGSDDASSTCNKANNQLRGS